MTFAAYPQISKVTARVQIAENAKYTPEQNQARVTELWSKQDVFFTTPSERQISTQAVAEKAKRVEELFREISPAGFDITKSSLGTDFDAALTAKILDIFPMSAYEAAQEGVWSFITLRALPGIAMWRFPNKREDPLWERYLGTERNTFKRLWWRAYMLGPELSLQLRENDLIQMFERGATVGSNRLVLRTIAEQAIFMKADLEALGGKSSDLVSEVGKRLKRQLAGVAFEAMPPDAAKEYVVQISIEAFRALQISRS